MFGIGSHMPIQREFWYAVPDHASDRYQCRSIFTNPRDLANDAAEDYYGNHDGWESTWPLVFVVYESEDGPSVGTFDVEMEAVPQFYARESPESFDAVGQPTENPILPRAKEGI